MSSGNPFRASLSYSPAASSPVPQTSFITADSSVPEVPEDGSNRVTGLEDASAPPLKTKKHVRIESNTTFIPRPASDAGDDSLHDLLAQQPNSSHYAGLSPSAPSNGFPSSTIPPAPSTTQTPGRATDVASADIWSSPRRDYQAPQSATSPSGIPANPFSRTLASIEPQKRGSGEIRTGPEKAGPGNNRASLDVESFKNLLMTGKPGPRPSGLASQTTAPPNNAIGTQFESSSSTDTSSISRQSLFEPPQETHTESPRTSYEMAESDEDERMGLVSEVKKGKKKPPPAPKHRHGKLVTPRQPQIVPFENFSASEPAPAPVTRPRDNSDVNKPLPATPVVASQSPHISTQDTTQHQSRSEQDRSSESLDVSDAPRPQKKAPPPVPLARRQSQLRTSTTGNRSRSSSSLTISSQHSVDTVSIPSPAPSNKDPLSVAKSPPPPPRSRHGARLTDVSTSSANSSSTELPQRTISTRTATPSQGPSSSRRSTLESDLASSSTDLHRTSSIASNRNSMRAVSNESTHSLTMPPPPPPPRRRQSNRSSLDQQRPTISSSSPTESRRTSNEHRRTSLDNKRRTSVASESSLRHEYAPSDEKGGNEYALYSPNEESENRLGSGAGLVETRTDSSSILDDMEKFQREIEELRQRYDKAK
ncbi:hypothetical protein EK21DRAFT_58872 [Setomelanomma holmii]|uniref:Uncharacterized protein n=1 Tax=Setomelanomma holmii TaxID=210430 RepID=A0A9P4HFF5_9PLEO|nr:hypothetical protein EK21DRAFT_58872 [Setomelanomma holmii]